MKDFKSFSSDGNNGKKQNDFDSDKGVKLVKSVAESMKGKSQSDIMRAVIEEAERGKRAGTLTKVHVQKGAVVNTGDPLFDIG